MRGQTHSSGSGRSEVRQVCHLPPAPDERVLFLSVGDDEQSDWFFEGDCGSGVAGLRPSWDSDSQLSLDDARPSPTFLQPARPSQRGSCSPGSDGAAGSSGANAALCVVAGYPSRLKRLPGSAACCIRKDRRRLPSKVEAASNTFSTLHFCL